MSAIQARLPEMPATCAYLDCEERPVVLLFPGPSGFCRAHDAEHRAFEQQHKSWRDAFAEGQAWRVELEEPA